MNIEKLPESVIKEDRRLSRSAEELCKLRWHWTLNTDNVHRISQSAYARQVGVSQQLISRDANAWEQYTYNPGVVGSGKPKTIEDFRAVQSVSEDRRQAVEAIAAQTGKSFSTIAKHHDDEVRAVVEMARDRVVRRGTTFEHEVQDVAAQQQHHRMRAKEQKDERQRHLMEECIRMQQCIGYAIRGVREAYEIAVDINFGDQELEFIADSLAQLRALVNLLDRRIVGKENTNWDQELKTLLKQYEGKEV